MSLTDKLIRCSNLWEILGSNTFFTSYCFISGLCCLLPLCLQLQSNIEKKLLRESLSTTHEFAFTSVASITAVVPLFFDVLLDVVAVIRSKYKSTVDSKRSEPLATKTTKFTFLNIPERMLILMGLTVLPFVAFLPTNTTNLGLIYLCCNKCQQCWVGGTVALSLSRYDKEYWSIRSTLISLISFSIGSIGRPFVDNMYAVENSPGQLLVSIGYLTFIFTIVPCIIFIFNSTRWLIVVYFRAATWKRFLMCTSKVTEQPEIESLSVIASNTTDHTFFPMVYTLAGTCVIILLSLLITTTSRIESYTGRDLWLNNVPFLVFVILLSTLSMRLVKFEVVQGLVSKTTLSIKSFLPSLSSLSSFLHCLPWLPSLASFLPSFLPWLLPPFLACLPSFLVFLPSLPSFLPWLTSFLGFIPFFPPFLLSLPSFLPSLPSFLPSLPSFLAFLPWLPSFLPSLYSFLSCLDTFLPFFTLFSLLGYPCLFHCVSMYLTLVHTYIQFVNYFSFFQLTAQAIKNSVVAQIDMSIFQCLHKDDFLMSKTVSRNVAFSLLDSLAPSVPLLG